MHAGCGWFLSAIAVVAVASAPAVHAAEPDGSPAPAATPCFAARIAVQTQVRLKQVPMSGSAREVPEWSQGATDHLHAALEGQLGHVAHVFVDPAYPPPTAGLLVDDAAGVDAEEVDAAEPAMPPDSATVAIPSVLSIATHPSRWAALFHELPEAAQRNRTHGLPLLDWLDEPVDGTMAPKLRQYFADLAHASGARCVLVVYASRSYPTKGVRSAQALLLPLGFAMGGLVLTDSGARKQASAYLIDPEPGVVLWHARLSHGIGDLRDAGGASKTIRHLLADLPASRQPVAP